MGKFRETANGRTCNPPDAAVICALGVDFTMYIVEFETNCDERLR